MLKIYLYVLAEMLRMLFGDMMVQGSSYDDMMIFIYDDMMTLTSCQDHILTEKIWFVWSKISYSGDKWRCHYAGRRQTVKIERLSQLEAGG